MLLYSYKNRGLLKLSYSFKPNRVTNCSFENMDTFGQADSEYGSNFSENKTNSQNQTQILTKIQGQYVAKPEKRRRGRPRKSATLGYSQPALSEIQSRTNDDQMSKSSRAKKKKKQQIPKLQQNLTEALAPKTSKMQRIILKPYEPKQLELCQALLILKKKLPNRSLQKVIIRLHEAIHTQKFKASSFNQSVCQTKLQSKQYQANAAFSTTNTDSSYKQKSVVISTFKLEENTSNYVLNYTQRPEQERVFYNPIEAQRYKQRKKLAKIYLQRGYGVTKKIDNQLPEIEMERNHYKSLLYGVLTAAFRRLQSFLFNDCKKSIKYLNRPQMKTITYPLLNSRVKLVPLHCETFFKFITLCYNLSDVTITQSEAIDLYVGVMKFLHGKNVTMEALQNIGRIDVKRNIEKSERQRGLDLMTTSMDYDFEDIGDDFTMDDQQVFPLLNTIKHENIEEYFSENAQEKSSNLQQIDNQTK